MNTDIHTFISSCVDEDERAMLAATQAQWWYRRDKMWLAGDAFVEYDLSRGEEYVGYGDPPFSGAIATTGPANDAQSMADAAFIAANSPAAVLRRIAAHRRILAIHIDRPAWNWPPEANDPACQGCGTNEQGMPYADTVDECPTLRALALAWTDRPGYNPKWS